jgi:hypothetical protein
VEDVRKACHEDDRWVDVQVLVVVRVLLVGIQCHEQILLVESYVGVDARQMEYAVSRRMG